MKLLYAAFLFIGLGSPVQGAVIEVEDFEKLCRHFFVDEQPPTFGGKFIPNNDGVRYHFICQTQAKKSKPMMRDYEYVTLYDTKSRIPVYSAYKYYKRAPGTKIRREKTWKIEPQLVHGELPYMTTEAESGVDAGDRGMEQAVNKDYEGSGYDKGHLYPVNHAHDQKAADGTFTLTNAAPQTCMFNKEWYNEVEFQVSDILDKYCKGEGYVVTGVIPSHQQINGRVNVTSHFWTAYCCMGHFFGSFIMSATDLTLSADPEDLKKIGIQPFDKCGKHISDLIH